MSRPARRLAPVLAVVMLMTVAPTAGAADPNYPTYDSRYHNLAEMTAEIKAAEAAYPSLVDLFSIGQSHQGRTIWAAKISDNVGFDEPEPEVLVDALHHAREHLTVEQALYLLKVLTQDYDNDTNVRRLVNAREIWIVFALNPDGLVYDLGGSPYRGWRKNRQPNAGSSYVGTDLNRNYEYHWGCCGGSSSAKSAWNYRGVSPFSAPETRAFRDFVNSRVIDGRQQIRTHVTLHTNGQLVLWPYGYTTADIPYDMTTEDHNAFVGMGKAVAAMNGYAAQQSSSLYVTDGDQIDWMYGRHRVFSFTWELYPTEHNRLSDFYPPDEVIAAQTARNRSALLYMIDAAWCPFAAIGKTKTHCGPFSDDLEIARGWQVDPGGHDTATDGIWRQADPVEVRDAGGLKQTGSAYSGMRGWFTESLAASGSDLNDVDGGTTTIRSPRFRLPSSTGDLTFRYYFAHGTNSSASDWLRVWIEGVGGTRTLVFQESGSAADDDAVWTGARVSLAAFAGKDVRIVIAANDGGGDSTVEAGIDDVRVERP